MCIYKDFIPYYDPAAGSIRACRSCYEVASKALRLMRFAFPSAVAFKDSRHTGRSAEERPTAIAIGSGLNRRTLKDTLLRVVQDLDTSHVNMGNLPKVALHFSVGTTVDVAPRTGPNQNKQGGRARVIRVKDGKYDVSYVLSSGEEKGLPLDLLSIPCDGNTGNRRSSSSEARRGQDVGRSHESELAAKDEAIAALRWEADMARGKERERASRLKEAVQMMASFKEQIEEAEGQLKQERLQRQIDMERMTKAVDDIAAEAAAEAVAEVESSMGAKLAALQQRAREERRLREQAEKEAEKEANLRAAEQARLLAGVQGLLDETRGQVEEEMGSAVLEAEAKVTSLDREVRELSSAPASLAAAASRLGITVEKKLRPGTGAGAASLAEIGSERIKSAVVRTAAKGVVAALKLASPKRDAKESATLVFAHPLLRPLVGGAATRGGPGGSSSSGGGAVEKNLATAVRIAAQQKEHRQLRQLLSLFPRTTSARVISSLCSSPPATFAAGDVVIVLSSERYRGHKRQYGRIASVTGEAAVVYLLQRTQPEVKQRYATAPQAAAAAVAEAEEGGQVEVPLAGLRHAAAVYISQHQVREAWKHAETSFAGAPVLMGGAGFTRQCKSLESVHALFEHLSNEEFFVLAEASRRNAERGVQFLRVMSMRRSYAFFKAACVRLGLNAIRWGDYLLEVSSKAYAKMTVLNCVCTYCRTLIYENKATFLECLDLLLLPQWLHDSLVKRINAHAMHVAVTYPEKIADVHELEHCDASLCARFALSTTNFEPWQSPCEHTNIGGIVGEQPETMNEICQRLHGRDATNDDWDSICGNDCGKDSGGFVLCVDCASVWCKGCIERTANDLGDGDWRCPECQQAVSAIRHYHPDVLLEDDTRIVAEMLNAASVVGFKPGALPELTDEDSHPGGATAATAAATGGSAYHGMYVADLRALLRERDLGGHGRKDELVSRLVQDDEDKGGGANAGGAGAGSADAAMGDAGGAGVGGADGGEVDEPVRRARDGLHQRLQGVLRKYREARAHKMRTIQFRRRKHRIIRELNATTALEMKDYSGKLEARKSKQGTSENLGKKLSNHGSIFVMRNPAQEIRDRHQDVDWGQFPAASEDVYLQVNCFVASDDSNQSAYHMGCMMEVTYKELKGSFPWLDTVIPFSDQCGDYHSTAATIYNHEIGRLTGIHVGRSEHSEVGEGKGGVDMKFGILAQQFYTTLANSNREDASDLFEQLEEAKRAGDYNMQASIDRSLFNAGSGKAIPYHDQCQCVVHERIGGGIRLYEFHGIGPGVPYSKAQLKAHDTYCLMESAHGSGSGILQSTEGAMVPTTRHTKKDRAEQMQLKTQKQEESAQRKKHKAEEDGAARAAVVRQHCNEEQQMGVHCGDCRRTYLSQSRFDQHRARRIGAAQSICEQRQATAVAKAQQIKSTRLAAKQLLNEQQAKREEEEKEEQLQLSVVVYEIRNTEDALAIALEGDTDSDGIVVSSVDSSRTDLALRVLKGYRLETCSSSSGGGGGSPLERARAALAAASAESPVKLTFSKPPPAMLAHGWARKKLRVATNNRVTADQKEWLEGYCDAYEKKGSQPRHTVVWKAMVNHRGLLHIAGGVPFVMSGTQIFNWLKRRWATQKAAGINLATAAAAAAEAGEGEEEDDSDDGGLEDYQSMTVAALRSLLKAKGLPSTGNKDALVRRLQEEGGGSDDESDGDEICDENAYEGMQVSALKDLIRGRNGSRAPAQRLALGGVKDDLVKRLQDDDVEQQGV